MAKKQISESRKALYYTGMGLSILGVLIFLSTFFTFMSSTINPESFMLRPVIGIVLIWIGSFLMRLGARGVAGSGVVLDPEKAREDLSPWSSMAGGVLQDALDETEIGRPSAGGTVVKVRCPNCKELNDEDARFCKSCGDRI